MSFVRSSLCVLALPLALTAGRLDAQSSDRYAVTAQTPLRSAPESSVLGQLQKTTAVEVLARDRGWVRVRTEGWVRESDLTPVDTAIHRGVSAADLRANPDKVQGMMLQWNVEVLAFQIADPLREGLVEGEPYLLVRGPDRENALIYMAIPPALVNLARALPPLTKVAVTARVRSGRSEPVGIPILDIQTLVRLK